ncbi:MAG TPA: hypothetical protein VMF58_02940 [Rhizomicrobium sp.]|nr:hypothetical protein [Rhizomicrobium sp.]
MRKTLLAFVSGLALSMSVAALADPAGTSAAAAATDEPMAQSSDVPHALHTEAGTAGATTQVSANGEKLICHHPVHEGTVLPQEVCLTQRDWDRIRLREQKNVNDWQMHGYQAGVH